MKPVKFFIFMPDTYVGLDTAIPFICCLKRQNWDIKCIFLTSEDFEQLKSFPIFSKILNENASIEILKTGSKYSLSTLTSITKMMLQIFLTSKPRIITFGGFSVAKNGLGMLLKKMSRFKGIYYVLLKNNAPMSFYYLEEYYLKGLNDPEQRRILGKKTGKFEAYSEKDYFGTILLQSKYEDKRADFFGFPKNRLYTGYYKLHEPWIKTVLDNPYGGNKILENEKSFFVIITKKGGEHFFDSENTHQILLEETVEYIRKHYKDTIILIKTKNYRNVDSNDWVRSFVEHCNDGNVIIDSTPLAFTAPKTIAAFFNVSSTAYIDFVINEVPCIAHERYGRNYYTVHPKGSFLPDFGVLRTSTVEELDLAISTVKDGTFKIMNRDSLKKHIEHFDDESTFKTL